jgi:glutathione S-transferase
LHAASDSRSIASGSRSAREIIDVFAQPASFLTANPLGYVPTLIGDGGFILSDSAMILEWAQARTGKIYPNGGNEWEVRQATVWCEGVIEAVVLYFQEEKLHEVPSSRWLDDHQSKISDTLTLLHGLSKELFLSGGKLTAAGWDLAVALEYLELRIPSYDWKSLHPDFVEWVKVAHQNAKFAATVPPK